MIVIFFFLYSVEAQSVSIHGLTVKGTETFDSLCSRLMELFRTKGLY